MARHLGFNVNTIYALMTITLLVSFTFACNADQGASPPPLIFPDGEEMGAPQDMNPPVVQAPLPQIEGFETLEDINPDPDIVEVNLRAEYATIDIGAGSPLKMMTYNGSFPGPLLQAKVGDRVIVHFENRLMEPTTVHWHGLRISDKMDGSPRVQSPVGPNQSFTYDFVVPDAGTFWYHPHVRTNEQVERGLQGAFIVHDPNDPVVDKERVLIIDDVLLQGDDFAPFLAGHMELMHGRTGNTLLLNGKAALPIKPVALSGVERWRIINTSNARTFPISLSLDGQARLISTDGGLLAQAAKRERIEVAVGQRYDLEVVATPGMPTDVTLNTHLLTINAQDEVVEATFPLYQAPAPPSTQAAGQPLAWEGVGVDTIPYDQEVEFVLDAKQDAAGRLQWLINGQAHSMTPLFTFKQGEVVSMVIKNLQGPEHPFHLHGQFFKVLDNGAGSFELGLKDTVLVPGRSTVKILAFMDNPGRWMAHCHILEHAELGMMSEVVVTPHAP